MTTFYIAGPMTNVPQFNVPLFDKTAAVMRARGLEVISPAELDSPEMRKATLASPDGDLSKLEKDTGETWGELLSRDVKIVADKVDGIVVLPNWQKSRGARLECYVGLTTGKDFFSVVGDEVFPVSRDYIRQLLRENMP